MELKLLFPYTLGVFNIKRDLSNKEKNFLNNLPTRRNLGNKSSTNHYILSDPTLHKINEFIEHCLSEYFFYVYDPKYDVKLKITQSWVNYTEKNEFHHAHSHPNSFVSGVFYVDTDDEDQINFNLVPSRPFRIQPKNYNMFNCESFSYKSNKGDLLLFPSTLYHNVPIKNNNSNRISIAFNSFPEGYTGDDEEFTSLHIEQIAKQS